MLASVNLLYGKLGPSSKPMIAIADFDGVCSTDIFVFHHNSFITNTFLNILYVLLNQTLLGRSQIELHTVLLQQEILRINGTNLKKIQITQYPLPLIRTSKKVLSPKLNQSLSGLMRLEIV